MAINVQLIRESFNNDLAPRAEELSDIFYDDLFTRYPQVMPLFENTDMASQKKKLMGILKLLVDNLDDSAVVADALTSLGERHANYNVKVEHYAMVADALLASLAKIMGDRWTPELKEAWTELYVTAAGIMQRACAV